jgi:hypothetical protein
MKIDFYRVEMPADSGTFMDLLETAANLPDDTQRTVETSERTIRLQEIQVGNLVECEMIRIRMDEVPIIASLAGEVKEIDLDPDEGIGEETAFLYSRRLNTLVLQRNRSGVTKTGIARYFEAIGRLDAPIVLEPVLSRDAIRQIANFREVRKFTVRLARINNPTLLVGDDATDQETVELLPNAHAPEMEITLSMGHQRGSLTVRAVQSAAKWIYRKFTGAAGGEEQATKLFIDGTLEDGIRTQIDMLHWQMVENINVQADQHRHLPYVSRKLA